MNDSIEPHPLSASRTGRRVCIAGVRAAPAADRLERLGVWTGDTLRVLRMSRGGVLVVSEDGRQMLLPVALARSILVNGEDTAPARRKAGAA
jgi:Fe2+ transport system protein FeoA